MTKKKRGRKLGSETAPPAFVVGSKVRVRTGVKDPDAPDMPIGAWCGTVAEVDTSGQLFGYLVEWDRRTLDSMHPVFIKRCRRDDLEVESMWLEQDDLEPNGGELLPIEQPTEIVTRPLRPEDPEDRIREVFGLTSDDPLPEVTDEALGRYHAYLAARLRLPLEARVVEEAGPRELRERRLRVERLLPPEDADEEEGLLIVARIGDEEDELPLWTLAGAEQVEQQRLIQDYAYWFRFTSGRGEAALLPFPGASLPAPGLPPVPLSLGRILNASGMLGAVGGAAVGSVVAVLEGARTWVAVGAGVLALLLGLAGRRYGALVGTVYRSSRGSLVGFLLGAVVGAALGAVGGALAVAYVGSVPGSIVGVVLGGLLAPQGKKTAAKFRFGLFGAILGGIVRAVVQDYRDALWGLAAGAVAGAVGAALLVIVAIFVLASVGGGRES